jgi:hypothetical protein
VNYRTANLLTEETHTAAGTKVLDILDTDILSRIDIKLNITRTTHTMSAHPAKDMAKIELVDGSTVLASLSGYECQALNIYNRKCGSMCHGQHYAGNGEVTWYGLDFGRWLWDSQLAFDPKKFKNPQLKITYTLTGSDAGATTCTLEVIGQFFNDKSVSPMGMLVPKSHYSWTPANSTYDEVRLPTDMPIRKILVRAYQDGVEPWAVVQNVRIDEGNLKKIIIDMGMETYFRMMKNVWSPVDEMLVFAGATTGRAVYVTPTQYYQIFSGDSSEAAGIASAAWGSTGGKLAIVTTSANTPFASRVWGWLPNHCIEFPTGNPNEPDDWWDVASAVSPRIRTQGAASVSSPAGSIVVEQLMKY